MKTPKEKYYNDPHYHALVNQMLQQIRKGEFTPSELREASIFASTLYEMECPAVYSVNKQTFVEARSGTRRCHCKDL